MINNFMKRTIVLFSRSELTYLYGSVDKYLKTDLNVIHIAYSKFEADILSSSFNIKCDYVFKNLLGILSEKDLDNLDIGNVDQFLLDTTNGKFNVNSALQANRTSEYLSYQESIELLKSYYLVWEKIFNENKIDFFIHEPVSLLMNQMASCFCNETGGIYSTHILVKGDKDERFSFIMVDGYNGIPTEINRKYKLITSFDINENLGRIEKYIHDFRNSFNVFFSQLGNGNVSFLERLQLFKFNFRSKISKIIKKKRYNPIVDNIEVFIDNNDLAGKRLKNLKSYKGITFDTFDKELKYYFYPLHLEPEAVVLYWADNKYTNQIKLIENIASQLPPNNFLYVKDHPHLIGYRALEDYKRLQQIPNVKLLPANISGKEIVNFSKGVITINGTAGFEALLMGKSVFVFGSSYYSASNLVIKIDDVFQLRKALYEIESMPQETVDREYDLKRFVLSFLDSTYPGFTDFYGGMHEKLNLDLDANGLIVAKSLKRWILDRGK